MTGEPVEVLLCDFRPSTGWRVRGVSMSRHDTVGIFRFGSIKLLRIPTTTAIRVGYFCNPKKIVLNFIRSKHANPK